MDYTFLHTRLVQLAFVGGAIILAKILPPCAANQYPLETLCSSASYE